MKKIVMSAIILAALIIIAVASFATLYFKKLAYSAVTASATKTVDTAAKPAPEQRQAHLPILVFHHIREYQPTDSKNDRTFIVPPKDFDAEMKYLADNGYSFITISQLTDYLTGGAELPQKSIAITFDDGDVNQYNLAFPILKKYNIVATFYIFVNPIGVSKNYLTWDEVREMSTAGMEIGSHGWYHLYLDRLSDSGDIDQVDREIVRSKKVIEEQLGQSVVSFCYPFGTYNDEVIKRVKNAGYHSARGIVNGKTHDLSNLYNLNAYFVTADFEHFLSIVK